MFSARITLYSVCFRQCTLHIISSPALQEWQDGVNYEIGNKVLVPYILYNYGIQELQL